VLSGTSQSRKGVYMECHMGSDLSNTWVETKYKKYSKFNFKQLEAKELRI